MYKIKRFKEIPIFDEKDPRLEPEDVDDSKQSIEIAAYYLGMERRREARPGDELHDWLRAEKAVKENLA